MARESLYVMEEMLTNAAEGDEMVVSYKKDTMGRGNKTTDAEMTVRVTDANPHSPSLMSDDAVVAVVTVNDDGEATKNTGYIGMNALGSCEAKPDNSYFPASKVMDVRPSGDA